jgi:hypothetical protein
MGLATPLVWSVGISVAALQSFRNALGIPGDIDHGYPATLVRPINGTIPG